MTWPALKRFLHYSLIGLGTFLFDLALLTSLTRFGGFNPVWTAGVSFLVAVSINYALSRHYIFIGTTRGHKTGYPYFILIAGVGLLFVTGSMYVLVTRLGWYYLVARVAIAAVTGIWNYTMNLFFNFKVAGFHLDQK
jgi:putative flippase GtrA